MQMQKPFPVWLIVSIWWTLYSMVFASSVVSMAEESGQNLFWLDAFKKSFIGWAIWIPVSLGIIRIVKKFPFSRKHALARLALLSFAAVAAVIVKALYTYFSNPLFDWYDRAPQFAEVVMASFRNNFMLAWLIIGIAHVFVLAARMVQREREILELQAHLDQAKLKALSAQLNPHFLFNALNSIAELIHIDQNRADNMLVSLSALLRRYLDDTCSQEITLRAECELTEHYLKIEKIRLAERLEIAWDVDPACLDAYLPAFVLQPLVENAIVHAIAKNAGISLLRIAASRRADKLEISVENTGSIGNRHGGGHGTGLRNMRERLLCLYGHERSWLEMAQTADGFVCVRIYIPFSTSPASTHDMAGDPPRIVEIGRAHA